MKVVPVVAPASTGMPNVGWVMISPGEKLFSSPVLDVSTLLWLRLHTAPSSVRVTTDPGWKPEPKTPKSTLLEKQNTTAVRVGA
jgi:hypothetical protein